MKLLKTELWDDPINEAGGQVSEQVDLQVIEQVSEPVDLQVIEQVCQLVTWQVSGQLDREIL